MANVTINRHISKPEAKEQALKAIVRLGKNSLSVMLFNAVKYGSKGCYQNYNDCKDLIEELEISRAEKNDLKKLVVKALNI